MKIEVLDRPVRRYLPNEVGYSTSLHARLWRWEIIRYRKLFIDLIVIVIGFQ